nr:RHS repeat-associated core domain-containing protein [Thioalkalivibrio sp. XN8]
MSFAHTFYVQAQGATVATIERSGTSTTNTTRYWHRDHLGSVVAITDEAGAVVERLAYDAWGKRRPADTWQTPTPGVFIAALSLTRGFTGHEHLDQVGLIHMGGRVYDPEIGRFLSPDPFVQFPASTQGFNRYAYVSNNPLSYTDPSGYFVKKLFKAFGIAMNFVPGLQLPNAFLHGFVSGFLVSGGDPKAAMLGGIGASVFNSIGDQFSGGSFGSTAHLQKTLAHGVTGGLLSAAGGGRFGDGFLGAASAQLAAPAIDQIGRGADGGISTDAGARFARIMAAATVGGTASTLGGGKFANGAITAGFARAFNDERHIKEQSRVKRFLDFVRDEGLDVLRRTASVVGGGGQMLLGGALCSSAVGCAAGAPIGLLGASNIQEGWTGEPGFVRELAVATMSEQGANLVVDGANLVTSGYGLFRHVLRPDAWKLFRHIRSDYVPAYQTATGTGLSAEIGAASLGLHQSIEGAR